MVKLGFAKPSGLEHAELCWRLTGMVSTFEMKHQRRRGREKGKRGKERLGRPLKAIREELRP